VDDEKRSGIGAIELLSGHHREVERLWTEARAAHTGGRHEQAQPLVEQVIELLSRHDAIETQLLYPTLRGLGERGDALADHSLEEHQQVRELLKEADRRDHREVWSTLERALTSVQAHVAEEERSIFPALRGVGDDALIDLGDAMQKAWKTAPTHPHPSTPDSGVGATVVGSMAAVVDRMRDLLKRAS
jgi:Hemerythrin HHE cation binding domain